MASLRRLQRARVWDPPCACGKEVFYSEEAAWAAIRAMNARRLIQYGQPAERDVYECPVVMGAGVYHLTSNDGRQKNHEALQAARAEREQFK